MPNGVFLCIQIMAHKVECIFPMVVDSMLPNAEFGQNDHREDPPHFTFCASVFFLPCALLGTRFMRIESGPFRFGSLKFPKLGTDDLDISKI